MNENEKDAYLHLMYRAFVEIRNISVFPFSWWKPCSWGKRNRYLWRINRLADAFHNLPFDLKTENISEIDKNSHWKRIKYYQDNFLKMENQYENLYTKILNGENKKIIE